MDEKNKQQIINELNRQHGYTSRYKAELFNILNRLNYNYSLITIDNNSSIILAVDRIMSKYAKYSPGAFSWREVGIFPFDKDYTRMNLSDDNDMLVVLCNPENEQNNIGIHITLDIDNNIVFELDLFSENYIAENELYDKIDDMVSGWLG